MAKRKKRLAKGQTETGTNSVIKAGNGYRGYLRPSTDFNGKVVPSTLPNRLVGPVTIRRIEPNPPIPPEDEESTTE